MAVTVVRDLMPLINRPLQDFLVTGDGATNHEKGCGRVLAVCVNVQHLRGQGAGTIVVGDGGAGHQVAVHVLFTGRHGLRAVPLFALRH